MGKTAAESMQAEFEKEKREKVLHQRFEWFLRKWTPEQDGREFEADLFMLIRAAHEDAARPYRDTMEKMMLSIPIMRASITG